MEVTGVNGQLELVGNKIVIKRKGMMAKMSQGLKGNKEILIKQISSIQFKTPGTFTNGYIQFTFSGGKEDKGGLFDATKDENSVMFTKKQLKDFEQFKAAVEAKIDELSNPVVQVAATIDVADQIEKLADLRSRNLITEEQFEHKKKELLGI